MESSVAQSRLCEAVEVGRGNLPAKSAPLAEAGIVNHDEQHVGCTRGRLDERDFVYRGVLVCPADGPLERGFRPRQDVLRPRRKGAGGYGNSSRQNQFCEQPYRFTEFLDDISLREMGGCVHRLSLYLAVLECAVCCTRRLAEDQGRQCDLPRRA